MPFGDRTGPAGFGPMTGRAGGYCAGYSAPGYMNFGAGFGRGLGRGWGSGGGFGRHYGRRFWGGIPYSRFGTHYAMSYAYPYHAPGITPKDEREALKEQARIIEEELKAINDRLVELEKLEKERK